MQGMGNMGVLLLLIAVGLGAWSLGRQNQDGSGGPGAGGSAAGSNGARANAGSPPNAGPQPQPQPAPNSEMPGGPKPQTSWGQSRPAAAGTRESESTPKNAWEKAREETRKREEERKAKEAEEKRREEAARRLRELRGKEAREREQREKEMKERAAKKEAEAAGKGSTYAYSSVGERTNPWSSGARPTAFAATAAAGAAASATQSEASPSRPRAGAAAQSEARSSPTRPPAPTAKTYLGTEEETYSFRPYDKPAAAKPAPQRKKSFSEGSEWSWAPSQSTSRTTPPPSARAPYTTKDPDKIVIKAVYSFVNQFTKTPASQLVSGVGSMTDGLILRITTEGLFIDDDVRGVAQREWDVKAWTLKLVEVWCPQYGATASSATPGATPSGSSFLKAMAGGGLGTRTRGNGEGRALSGDDADAYLADMLRACKDCCRLGLYSSSHHQSNASSSDSGYSSASRSSYTESNSGRRDKTGEWKAKALHLLRATIRDQEGKRYLFVISEEESWKVSVGLQRLRRGTQVRALGVAGLSGLETKSTLEMLGWGR
jgi:hypothetical protein